MALLATVPHGRQRFACLMMGYVFSHREHVPGRLEALTPHYHAWRRRTQPRGRLVADIGAVMAALYKVGR